MASEMTVTSKAFGIDQSGTAVIVPEPLPKEVTIDEKVRVSA
jgi:hypothetical protein